MKVFNHSYLALLFVAGCGNSERLTAIEDVSPFRIEASASAISVDVGVSKQLTARIFTKSGNELVAQTVLWSSLNAEVAAVSPAGLVTGIAEGLTKIVVSIGVITDTVAFEVTDQVLSYKIEPAESVALEHGDTVRLHLRAVKKSGISVPASNTVWSTTNSAILSVNQAGLVTAVRGSGFGLGTSTVSAHTAGVTTNKSLTVRGWSYSRTGDAVTLDSTFIMRKAFANSSPMSLNVSCVQRTRHMLVYVTTGGKITANGEVTYRFSNDSPRSGLWGESSNFNTLYYSASQAGVRAFAKKIAAADTMFFQYREFQGGAQSGFVLVTDMMTYVDMMTQSCPP